MPVFRFRTVLVVAALLALGCASEAVNVGGPTDDFGTPLPRGRALSRIVSLNPTTTELLFTLGESRRVVGRSQYDVYPDSARFVASVGNALRPVVESILARRPDLVIMYASADNRPAARRLEQAGISVVAFKIDSIAQFERVAREIGMILGDSAKAAATIDTMDATIQRVRQATASLPRPSVFIHVWDNPIMAIGGGSFLSQLVDIAGGRNVYADVPAPSVTVTMEDVVRRNPDYVLTGGDAAAEIERDPKWQALPAVRAHHVLGYDTLVVGRPSTQFGAAAVSLANLLHPGVVR